MKFAWGIFALVVISGNALGQTPDIAKADALFREGRAAMKAGDLQTACPKLEESYRLDPTAGSAVNLGDCFDKQGKVASALLAYRAARKLLKPNDPRIAPVEQQTADLEKRAPKLTITLAPDAPEGVTVTRDGRVVDFAELGSPFVVNPGRVTVVVSAPGHDQRTYSVDLSESETRVLVVDAGPPKRDSAAPIAPVQTGRSNAQHHAKPTYGSTQRTLGYVAGAVGVGFVIFGTINAVDWKSKLDDLNATRTPSEYERMKPNLDGPRTRTFVGFGLGGVALASSMILVLTSGSGNTDASRLQICPSLLARGGGGQIGGIW